MKSYMDLIKYRECRDFTGLSSDNSFTKEEITRMKELSFVQYLSTDKLDHLNQ